MPGGELRVDVLDDDDRRRESPRQPREDSASAAGPPVDAPMATSDAGGDAAASAGAGRGACGVDGRRSGCRCVAIFSRSGARRQLIARAEAGVSTASRAPWPIAS